MSRYVILDLRLWLTGPPMHDYWSRDFFLLPFLRCDVVVLGCVVLISFVELSFIFCNIRSLIKEIKLCCFIGVLGSILWQSKKQKKVYRHYHKHTFMNHDSLQHSVRVLVGPRNEEFHHSVFNLICDTFTQCVHQLTILNCLAAVVKKGTGSQYSITERRVLQLIPVLGSQPAGDASHKPGGRLPLLSARPAVTTLKRAATNFAAWWTQARWVWAVCLILLLDGIATAI